MYALGALVIGIVLLYVCMCTVEGFDNNSPPLKKNSDIKNSKIITINLLMKSVSDIKVIGTPDPIIKKADMNGNSLSVTFNPTYKIHDYTISGLNNEKKLFLSNFDLGLSTPTLKYKKDAIRRDNIKDALSKFPITPDTITIEPIVPSAFGGIDKLNKDKSNISIDFLVSPK